MMCYCVVSVPLYQISRSSPMALARHPTVTDAWVAALSKSFVASFHATSHWLCAPASFCSLLFVSIACQEWKHERRLTVQTHYIPAWAPMSYVSFSCCLALLYLAAIYICRPEKKRLFFSLFRILHWCSETQLTRGRFWAVLISEVLFVWARLATHVFSWAHLNAKSWAVCFVCKTYCN